MKVTTTLKWAAVSAAFISIALPSFGQLIVANAALREEIRQQTEWTDENISKHPYLFIQDHIRKCDDLKAKIEAQTVTLTRMSKEAARKVEEADVIKARYSRFMDLANKAYDEAEATGKWPVVINGYEMDEEELCTKMDDAVTRLELAEKDKKQNIAIGKKVEIRKTMLKKRKRETVNLRLKLVQLGEQVKMNEALAEIDGLKDVLGTISDMMVEIDEDPTKLSVDELMEEDPKEAQKARIRAIRERAKKAQ